MGSFILRDTLIFRVRMKARGLGETERSKLAGCTCSGTFQGSPAFLRQTLKPTIFDMVPTMGSKSATQEQIEEMRALLYGFIEAVAVNDNGVLSRSISHTMTHPLQAPPTELPRPKAAQRVA